MAYLHESLRKSLEKVVVAAREVAEEAAGAALDRLAVGSPKPHGGASAEARALRTRLRARGRQLGDGRKASGEQAVGRLVTELAYEHWHRMLFARFLAENDLLIHPEAGVSVSLADCEELAAEEGLANGWLLAERWAARMLPEIFRPADPLLQVPLAPEHERALERLLESVSADTFRASDALGWVYQFWQAKQKKAVNESGVKIGAEELPAVTQLFTEPYMVHFLLDNTLGAWWMGRHPGEAAPVAFEYLRTLEDGTPAAGTFDGWPARVAELTVLDPCCGSGHFLVAALEKLVPLRMREEGLTPREACDAVLRDNLHGLEIDPRCTQIAAFAVALAAWTYPEAGGYRVLPALNIACSGTPVSAKKEEWLALAQGDTKLEAALGRLWELFRQAPELGSLIDPTAGVTGDLLTASFSEVQPLLDRALASERVTENAEREAVVVAAMGIAKAAELLARRYTLVATNVPYLARGKQAAVLQDFAEAGCELSKSDLATMLIERCDGLLMPGASMSVVTPEAWLSLGRYRGLRRALLDRTEWNTVARLGAGAFSAISGEVVKPALVIISRQTSRGRPIAALAVANQAGVRAKAGMLRACAVQCIDQARLLATPDAIVAPSGAQDKHQLGEYAFGLGGITTGDSPRYRRQFWEIPTISGGWVRQQSTVNATVSFGGRDLVLLWEGGTGSMAEPNSGATIAGREAWTKRGVAVQKMGTLPSTLYMGEQFENVAVVILPKREEWLPAIWAFCASPEFGRAVREVDQSIGVTCNTMVKIPFAFEHWAAVAKELYPNGLPEPHSDDPTQWLFQGDISTSTAPLQVAVARLLGYRWPDQAPDVMLDPLADKDGIVCLPPVSGERPAADRLRDLLAAAYGKEWSAAKLDDLLAQAGSPGTTLESWLRDDFFAQHCALFHQRPFLWHLWDGRKDGFAALVNYHRLDRHTLETVSYRYLGDWLTRQAADAKAGKPGADARLAAAQELQEALELILEGEPPYDIFVRWKALEAQPLGWEPDLNDGVRLNIRPFVEADVLRKRPSIHWRKDRGKNPPGTPWHELGEGERFNSYEEYSGGAPLTNALKRAARKQAMPKARSRV